MCGEESDSEVFECNSTEAAFARTSSSSSSRKSSYEDVDDKASLPPDHHLVLSPSGDHMTSPSPAGNPPTIVEWKPQGAQLEQDLASPRTGGSKDSSSESLDSPPAGDLKAIYGSTVTVTIDPPQDTGGGVDAEVSSYLDGGGGDKEIPAGRTRNLADMFGKPDDEVFDLFESLNEADLADSEDDGEPATPTKICLLSK